MNKKMTIVLITGAVKEEIKPIIKKLHKKQSIVLSQYKLYEGDLYGIKTVVMQTGVGVTKAKKAIHEVLKNYAVSYILSIGFAGSVDENLTIGDLIFCNPLLTRIDQKIKHQIEAEKQQADLMKEVRKNSPVPFHAGPTLTVDTIVSTVSKKKEIKETFGVLAVEMENSAIAQVAASNRVPFVMVRSISDTASDDISFLDPFSGNPKKIKIAFYALSHPDIIPGLQRLRKNCTIASRSLASFVDMFYSLCFCKAERNGEG